MSNFVLSFRNAVSPPKKTLKEAGIQPGHTVLDYGCGPGGHSIAAAKLVGPSGKVYALDIHPLPIRTVQKKASRKGLKNIETIQSDCATGLQDNRLDIVLLYDTFHELNDPQGVLAELTHVLKPEGALSLSDHHLEEQEIIRGITESGLFSLLRKDEKTYTFKKM
jgi:ubiquinone/menaquinone biosynthesis C-methylase UbiE